MFLKVAVGSSRNQGGGTAEILRGVFAEEKAAAVRDTMNEYLNRLGMHMREPAKALEETRRLEKQLSEQLTRLKNSVIHDGHVTPSAIKWWANGAAFHSQMVIHEARLETTDRIAVETKLQNRVASINSVVDRHDGDLQQMLGKIFPDPLFSSGWFGGIMKKWDQMIQLKSYFPDLRKNIRQLITQHDSFKYSLKRVG